MAHLRSKAILGYFPTPARVADAIARHLAAEATAARRAIRLLDPCAGEGGMAATLVAALGAVGFGIELHETGAPRSPAPVSTTCSRPTPSAACASAAGRSRSWRSIPPTTTTRSRPAGSSS